MREQSRKFIHARDKFLCYICGVQVIMGKTKERKGYRLATVDHVIPRSRGGTSESLNVRCCCRECNEEKADTVLLTQ